MGEKIFLDYDEQVDLLTSKKLIINDRNEAIKLLKKYSYFNLINGYKKPFKNSNGEYKNKTKIEDIFYLYKFDDELRHTLMKYLLIIELHIKSLLSYSFCKEFGNDQSEYQNALNYNYQDVRLQKSINELIQILSEKVGESEKFIYLEHQKKNHNNIPLWVLVKALTFGNISKMYSCQKDTIKTQVSKNFPEVNEKNLGKMLDILTRYRNVCAHNERLFDFKYNRASIKNTSVHQYFKLNKGNKRPSNLFDVIIFLKYLLGAEDFEALTKEIKKSIEELSYNTNQIQKNQLYRLMGFPKNWENINKLTPNFKKTMTMQ